MNIAVYCGSNFGDKPEYAQAARELGTWIGETGHTLVYGGSAVGLMGTVAKATMEAGGRAIGVEPRFFLENGVPQLELSELKLVETMAERRTTMIELADAFVALPGGVGTLEEITEIMSRIRLRLTNAPCVVVNVAGFYDELEVLLDRIAAAGFMQQDERDAVAFVRTVAETITALQEWSSAGLGAPKGYYG